MSTETYTERLAKVREAIDKLLSGSQSWSYNGRQYTRANIFTLERMERHYAKMAAREQAAAAGRGTRNRVRYIGW